MRSHAGFGVSRAKNVTNKVPLTSPKGSGGRGRVDFHKASSYTGGGTKRKKKILRHLTKEEGREWADFPVYLPGPKPG